MQMGGGGRRKGRRQGREAEGDESCLLVFIELWNKSGAQGCTRRQRSRRVPEAPRPKLPPLPRACGWVTAGLTQLNLGGRSHFLPRTQTRDSSLRAEISSASLLARVGGPTQSERQGLCGSKVWMKLGLGDPGGGTGTCCGEIPPPPPVLAKPE